MRLLRAGSNIAGPKQRQDRLVPPDRKAHYKREHNNQMLRVNKSDNPPSGSKTLNTISTTFTNETTKVSCRNSNDSTKATNDAVPIMDNSNSSCLTSVCVTPSKSNHTQSPPTPPPLNNTHNLNDNIITTTTRITSTSSPNLDVKLNNSESIVSSNQPCITSGNNTSSYCTTIVKSKSEW